MATQSKSINPKLNDLWDCIILPDGSSVDTKKDQRALAAICLNVRSHCFVHFKDVTTIKLAWEILSKAYEDTGLSRILILTRSLFKLDYANFENMNQYVSETLNLSQKLADIGTPVEDKLLAVIHLAGLPLEYKPMVMALDSLQVQIAADLVKTKLLQKDAKIQLENNSGDVAFAIKQQQKHYNKRRFQF